MSVEHRAYRNPRSVPSYGVWSYNRDRGSLSGPIPKVEITMRATCASVNLSLTIKYDNLAYLISEADDEYMSQSSHPPRHALLQCALPAHWQSPNFKSHPPHPIQRSLRLACPQNPSFTSAMTSTAPVRAMTAASLHARMSRWIFGASVFAGINCKFKPHYLRHRFKP